MANSQDEARARQQAQDEAMKQRLTSEQQRERQQKILSELERKRQLASNPDREEQEREAHKAAVQEAFKQGKETEGSQRIKVRTTYTDTEASSRIKGETSGRTEKREQRQFAQSGAPVQLAGDKQAIQEVRAQAFQTASRKAQVQGRPVTQEAIDRETRNILSSSGGRVSVVDEGAKRQAIGGAYENYKSSFDIGRPIAESDDVYLTPVSGLRGRSVYEGFFEGGDKKTVVIGAPKIETLKIRDKPAENDFLAGAAGPFQDVYEGVKFSVTDLFGGRQVPRHSYDPETGFITSKSGQPDFKPGVESSLIGSGVESAIKLYQGKPVTADPFIQNFKEFSTAPAYFAGSVAASAALFLIPSSKSLGLVRGGAKAFTAVTYAKAAKPIAATFVKTFRQPGFEEIAASVERMGYLGKRPGPVLGLSKQFFGEQKLSVGKELSTLERDFGLDLMPSKTRIAEFGTTVKDVAGPPIERAVAARPRLPELPQFGAIIEPITSRAKEAGEIIALPFRATGDFARLAASDISDFGRAAGAVGAFPFRLGYDAASRGLDVFTGGARRVKTTIEPYAYLRPNAGRIKEAIDSRIVQPLQPLRALPFTEPFFTGAASAQGIAADARFAGGVLNLGLEPYRVGGRRVRNFFESSIATFEADTFKFTKEGTAARAGGDILRALDQGEILGLQRPGKGRAIFDIGTEDTGGLFQSGFIKISKDKGAISFVTREALTAEQREGMKGIAKIEGIFEVETKGRTDLTPFGEIRDATIREMLPKTTKADRLPIFKEIELTPEVDDYLQTFSKVPRAAKEPKRVADVITYPVADIVKYAKALQSPDDVVRLSGADVSRALGLPEKRSSRLFDFEKESTKLAKTSRTPLETAGAFDFDRGLQGSSKAVENFIKDAIAAEGRPGAGTPAGLGSAAGSSRFLGLGGGSDVYRSSGPIGLYGITGAGRRRRRDESVFTSSEIETLLYPKTGTSSLKRLENFSGSRSDSTLKNILSELNRVGTGLTPKTGTAPASRLDTFPRIDTIVRTESATRTGQQTDQMTKQMMQQLTRQITTTRTTPQRTPRIPPFVFPFAGEQKLKKKKQKGRKTRAAPRQGWIKDLISATLGEQAPIARDFRRLFDDQF